MAHEEPLDRAERNPARRKFEPEDQYVEEVYLRTRDAARVLGISPRTLEAWRVKGEGPPFSKIGHAVGYRYADLLRWAIAQRRHSTSDPGPGH